MSGQSLWSRLRARLSALDSSAASSTLQAFEAQHGLKAGLATVSAGSATDVARAAAPHGRPVVQHHWATWCAPCLDELPEIQSLTHQLRGAADVVTISWDRFDTAEPLVATTREHVRDVADGVGLDAPIWLVDDTPAALFEAMHIKTHTVPQTHVFDADGGLLKTYHRALTNDDVRAILNLLLKEA